MKTVVRIALLSLVLLSVALISALTAMHFAIHGREVAVPNLLGMAPADAERASMAYGLQIEVQREYYSPNVPEGKIMSQVPPPGTVVKRGFQVEVARSLGPQRIAIPDVTGQTPRAAQINIERRGLDLGTVAMLPLASAATDQVVAQSPPPNASGVSAPRISLLVSTPDQSPAFVMPNFVGQPLASASNLVQSSGMRVGKVSVADPEAVPSGTTNAMPPNAGPAPAQAPPNPNASAAPSQPAPLPSPSSLILSQNPAAGQKIVLGTAIDFEVSR
jgi:eukaryotic-like serine/threonine-protein kinase